MAQEEGRRRKVAELEAAVLICHCHSTIQLVETNRPRITTLQRLRARGAIQSRRQVPDRDIR
jgi:hypothetical protein